MVDYKHFKFNINHIVFIFTFLRIFMTKIHIATVGFKLGGILDGFRNYSVDKLYLLYNKHVDSRGTAQEVEKIVEQSGGDSELVEIDINNIQNVIETIINIHNKHKGDELFVNITGGSKIVAAGALIGGFLVGSNVYYMRGWAKDEDEGLADKAMEIPLPKVKPTDLPLKIRNILKYISQNPNSNVSEIASEFEISNQFVSKQVNKLIESELIKEEWVGRKKLLKITNSGKIMIKLID